MLLVLHHQILINRNRLNNYQSKTKIMKKFKTNHLLLLVCLQVLSFASCSKSDSELNVDLYKNSPSSPVPVPVKGGIWFWGNIGPIAYYDRDGHQVGNETEAAREYVFKEVNGQGRFEFTQYLGMRNASNCITEIYTTKKGTIVFNGADKLNLYPVEGSFRTVKSGCSAGTTSRPAEAEDLVPMTYLWEIKMIENEPVMYMYEHTDLEKENPIFVYSFSI